MPRTLASSSNSNVHKDLLPWTNRTRCWTSPSLSSHHLTGSSSNHQTTTACSSNPTTDRHPKWCMARSTTPECPSITSKTKCLQINLLTRNKCNSLISMEPMVSSKILMDSLSSSTTRWASPCSKRRAATLISLACISTVSKWCSSNTIMESCSHPLGWDRCRCNSPWGSR